MRKPEAMEILTTTIKAIHENKKVGMAMTEFGTKMWGYFNSHKIDTDEVLSAFNGNEVILNETITKLCVELYPSLYEQDGEYLIVKGKGNNHG